MSSEIPFPLGFAIIAVVIVVVRRIYQQKIQRINRMPDRPRSIPGMPRGTEEIHFSGARRISRVLFV